MIVKDTEFDGLIEINSPIYKDERGYFFEAFNMEQLHRIGFRKEFLQDNISCSSRGTLRGLHFQNKPYEQGKLISVLKGRVLDVAVDLRKNSKTFGQYYSKELSEFDNGRKVMLYIPEGFAHGFLALEDNTLFAYKCTQKYKREAEDGIVWDDPQLNIDWRLEKEGLDEPNISEKDRKLSFFNF